MKTMRVLVYGVSGEVSGGIESFVLGMSEHMSERCVFDYVIVGERCVHADRIRAKGGRIYMVTSYRKNPLKFLHESWKTAKAARKDHNVAYFNLFSMCHTSAVAMCRLLNYRIVMHAHNSGMPGRGMLYRLMHVTCRKILGLIKCIRLTNSEESGRFMFGKKFSGPSRAETVYNGVEVGKYRFSQAVRDKKRAEMGIGGEFAAGFAGRLSTEKNPDFLMDVFYEISKRKNGAVFLVVGDGDCRDAMVKKAEKMQIAGSVHFLGRRTDLSEIYQAMDCLILPSLSEGLGIVLVEAQASGLHCFASAGAVPKIVGFSDEIMHFIPLSDPPGSWADRILKECAVLPERTQWNDAAKTGPFNIETEAVHLERILMQEG